LGSVLLLPVIFRRGKARLSKAMFGWAMYGEVWQFLVRQGKVS